MITLTVNGTAHPVSSPPDTPLLWALRDALGLNGVKYGCGVGICGSCTVLVDDEPQRACVLPIGAVVGRAITTIEGLTQAQHPLLTAWIAEQVPQCGYCQPAQILTAAALLARHPTPSAAQVDAAMAGVLCRCATYRRVRRAIRRAAESGAGPGRALAGAAAGGEATDGQGVRLNPWVRIERDHTVTVIIDRSEMGQGVVTSLAMLVAEELEMDLVRVRTAFAPAHPSYNNCVFDEQVTGGSTSVRGAWLPLRRAGAEARQRLVAAAARRWGVEPGACRAQGGAVWHPATGRRFGYGELAEQAAALPPAQEVSLKPPEQFRLIGKATPRIELPDMVIGRTVYAIDVALDGVLYATVARCPVFGGALSGFDSREALRLPGVRHAVAIDTGIAVVADTFPAALRGRDALEPTWERGANTRLSSDGIAAELREALRDEGRAAREEGDARRVITAAGAGEVIEAIYETPYLAHATLEPMSCVARVTTDRCDVWAGTQNQQDAHATAARLSGLDKTQVRIHTTFLGGGFGRRLESDFVAEAVQIARAVQAPVKLIWTRQDDLQHDHYRPANATLLRAVAGDDGLPSAWFQRLAGPPLSLEGVDLPYAIPNLRVEGVERQSRVPTGAWRSVGASQNAFAIECFVDELAHAAGRDPIEFRCALLGAAPRQRGVLELAAEKAGWSQAGAAGRYLGVASYRCFRSWAAQVVEVARVGERALRIERVVCALDCGITVNPDTVVAQMEGAVGFALSAALKEAIVVQDGQVQQSSFEDYPLLTFAEMPAIDVYIVPSTESPGGVGEPGVPPLAPALANAVFAATGRRLRRLPLPYDAQARVIRV